jgi:hypothetical protein
LKLRTKFNGAIQSPEFIKTCLSQVAVYDEAEIEEHIEKYVIYMELDSEKRDLVDRFKQIKNEEKDTILEMEKE